MTEEQQTPRETAKAAAAFADYVALGPERSLAKLGARYGHPPSYVRQLQRWSADFDWQARLKAIADAQLAEATELRRAVFLAILRDYHRRYGNDAMVQAARTDELHGVYDRVKPAEALEIVGNLTTRVELVGVAAEDV